MVCKAALAIFQTKKLKRTQLYQFQRLQCNARKIALLRISERLIIKLFVYLVKFLLNSNAKTAKLHKFFVYRVFVLLLVLIFKFSEGGCPGEFDICAIEKLQKKYST